mmetsp:Transcript_23707/g.46691  ORF Transcript_23707/g.46691 Transcript_23707/m.46691 type:complete len:97 (-) Transcript_23707:69-359(-)|eukprot:CAMPEP_0175162334 /NCGR_PEP_ID=MMETSP0087-20121206/25096_1 /TAXON_ID=136419 /ORGANISM="Unknown Unknown, Strain D1" /LENGTH=96 /DNA_ID=CAMNT_0016450835 /DNA_START=25 /DNA_END=315 /DNA_ORIENTATION=+
MITRLLTPARRWSAVLSVPVRTFSITAEYRDHSRSFLSGSNAVFIDSMFEQWAADPKSVHPSWDAYFRTDQYQAPPVEHLVATYPIPPPPERIPKK